MNETNRLNELFFSSHSTGWFGTYRRSCDYTGVVLVFTFYYLRNALIGRIKDDSFVVFSGGGRGGHGCVAIRHVVFLGSFQRVMFTANGKTPFFHPGLSFRDLL